MASLTKLLHNLSLIHFGNMLSCESIDPKGGKFNLHGNHVYTIYKNNIYLFFTGPGGVSIVLTPRDLRGD